MRRQDVKTPDSSPLMWSLTATARTSFVAVAVAVHFRPSSESGTGPSESGRSTSANGNRCSDRSRVLAGCSTSASPCRRRRSEDEFGHSACAGRPSDRGRASSDRARSLTERARRRADGARKSSDCCRICAGGSRRCSDSSRRRSDGFRRRSDDSRRWSEHSPRLADRSERRSDDSGRSAGHKNGCFCDSRRSAVTKTPFFDDSMGGRRCLEPGAQS